MLTIVLTLVLIMHFIVQVLFLNIFCHRLRAYVSIIKTVIPLHFYYPKHTSLLPLGNVHNNKENKRIDKKMFFFLLFVSSTKKILLADFHCDKKWAAFINFFSYLKKMRMKVFCLCSLCSWFSYINNNMLRKKIWKLS